MKPFFDTMRPLFGGHIDQKQMDGLNTLLAAVSSVPDLRHRAYILATAYHETWYTMQPIREAKGLSDDDTIRRLDAAFAKGQLTWVKKPYWRRDKAGKAWYGRGYVQLTHRDNYARLGARLGVDLVGNPDIALQPTVAARVIVVGMTEGLFTGRSLSDFSTYEDMRRVVNGTDRAKDIAVVAEEFERALRAVTRPVLAPNPIARPITQPITQPIANPFAAFAQAVLAALAAIFGRKP